MKVTCNCKHAYQDETLGKGIRWATPVNKSKKDGKAIEARCTVCRSTTNKIH